MSFNRLELQVGQSTTSNMGRTITAVASLKNHGKAPNCQECCLRLTDACGQFICHYSFRNDGQNVHFVTDL